MFNPNVIRASGASSFNVMSLYCGDLRSCGGIWASVTSVCFSAMVQFGRHGADCWEFKYLKLCHVNQSWTQLWPVTCRRCDQPPVNIEEYLIVLLLNFLLLILSFFPLRQSFKKKVLKSHPTPHIGLLQDNKWSQRGDGSTAESGSRSRSPSSYWESLLMIARNQKLRSDYQRM